MSACAHCGLQLSSRNRLFAHLREGVCAASAPPRPPSAPTTSRALITFGYTGAQTNAEGAALDVIKAAVFTDPSAVKWSHAAGFAARGSALLAQDAGCSAAVDCVAVDVDPGTTVAALNASLRAAGSDAVEVHSVLHGCPAALHCERDASQRRYEYVLPLALLHGRGSDAAALARSEADVEQWSQRPYGRAAEAVEGSSGGAAAAARPAPQSGSEVRSSLREAKRVARLFTALVAQPEAAAGRAKASKLRAWHSFSSSPLAVPADAPCTRSLGRIVQLAKPLLRVGGTTAASEESPAAFSRFLVLSFSARGFLAGQVQRLVALIVALCRGLVADEAALLDSCFSPLEMVSLPAAPVEGLLLAGLGFARWSGRCDAAHAAVAHSSGERCAAGGADATAQARHHRALWGDAARFWSRDGVMLRWLQALDGAIVRAAPPPRPAPAVDEKARTPESAASREAAEEETCCPPIYRRTLRLLRAAARSGQWPASSERRQRVLEPQAGAAGGGSAGASTRRRANAAAGETSEGEVGADADATADAMTGLVISRPGAATAARAACGSFSIGTMPSGCAAPRGNALFPELMAAAFELEHALCAEAPASAALAERRPSAMVAVNRNTLFRPHRDTGAGRGQSKALIVGLGQYSGGGLVIEGDAVDVRYAPLQFDSWALRHWTKKFTGERFTLVFFTPNGCEFSNVAAPAARA